MKKPPCSRRSATCLCAKQNTKTTPQRDASSARASYDFSSNELAPAGPIPPFLHTLRERIAEWVEVPASRFTHALIAEYKTGTQLGWHRDVPDFEIIVGVS